MTEVEKLVRGLLESDPETTPAPNMVQVAPRITELHREMLDAIAERVGMSRTALAGELLEAAINDVGYLVGVEIIPAHADHPEPFVGLFDDPREKK